MKIKSVIACLAAVSTMYLSAQAADVTTTLSDVHICCGSCVKGVAAAVAGIPGVTAKASEEDSTVVVTGPDTASVQKAANALTAAGFFGKSSNADIKIDASTGATGAKLTTLTVDNVHLCCAKCVTAVNKILGAVPGVVGPTTAAKGAKSFVVTGNFTDTDIFNALQKAGFTGKVAPKS